MRIQQLFKLALLISFAFGAQPARAATAINSPVPVTACQQFTVGISYIVANNIDATTHVGTCFEILADYVHIDFNGYVMEGPGVAALIGDIGVGVTTVDVKGVTIKNGVVTGFGNAINMSITGLNPTADGKSTTIKDMKVIDNTLGILVGEGSLVMNNISAENQSYGFIFLGKGSVILNNVSRNNGALGFQIDCPSVFEGNTSTGTIVAVPSVTANFSGINNCSQKKHNAYD